MIESSQRMIGQQNSLAVNKHFKLQIKILQNASRDPPELTWLLQVKEREKQEAMYIDTKASYRRD
jgi:hypothetical protein